MTEPRIYNKAKAGKGSAMGTTEQALWAVRTHFKDVMDAVVYGEVSIDDMTWTFGDYTLRISKEALQAAYDKGSAFIDVSISIDGVSAPILMTLDPASTTGSLSGDVKQ